MNYIYKMCTIEDIEKDFAIIEDLCEERKPKVYRKRFNPFKLDDDDFYLRYRFDKIASRFLISLLNVREPKNRRGLPISKDLQVLSTLRFLGRNAHQGDVADLHGLSHQTVGRIVKTISKQIALLLPDFIKFPKLSEISEMKKAFFNISHFPNVIGVIDCIQLHVKSPGKKGVYPLEVQVVYDADCKIIDLITRYRDSTHNSLIWFECQLKAKLEQKKNQHNGVLLGDMVYPLSTILLTPFENPSTSKERRYNKCHIGTRSKTQSLNGQLKSKLNSIFARLRVDLDTAKNIVLAVAVLHNIAMERNFSFLREYSVLPDVTNIDINGASSSSNHNSYSTGNAYRSAFVNAYF